jgi:hypothetical protein
MTTFIFWSLIVIACLIFALVLAAGVITLIGRVNGWGDIHDEERDWVDMTKDYKNTMSNREERN